MGFQILVQVVDPGLYLYQLTECVLIRGSLRMLKQPVQLAVPEEFPDFGVVGNLRLQSAAK